ncbi:MAG TPA: aminotransferase class V-fold PLP-dependent enzyme [Candidatus Limnocylindrales bacterium]|jgi:kynureninase|nr:aminotransferase class V-fold PLP-dependent enzyme [Candidatus Limnocylindrales bacterium]
MTDQLGLERDVAAARDATDPLASLRDGFVIDDPERIYLDGNSLGRLSQSVAERLASGTAAWGSRVVEGWPDWIGLPAQVGDRLAAACLGAQPGEVLVCDSTTVNLFKLTHAMLDVRDGPVVTDAANFPTDRYVLGGVATARGREFVLVASAEEALARADAALICLSHVDYRSGRLLDMAAAEQSTRVPIVWDLSHSAGAVAIDLSGADLAIGCSYKYLNAGPGGPGYLYVRRELQDQLQSPIQGWFGQADQFAMSHPYQPVAGLERFLAGTPPILGILALDASLDMFEEAGMDRVTAKAAELTDLAIALHDAWLAPLGFELATPRAASERGAHVALRHREAWPICRALIEKADVIVDFRQPDVVRFGFPPLYTRFVDVWDGLDRLRSLVEKGVHRTVDSSPRRVT